MRINTIISDSNALIKQTVLLKDKKYRDEQNKFLVEGLFSITDADSTNIESVFITDNCLTEKKLDDLLNKVDYYVVSEKVIKKLSDTVTPQGIIAVVKKSTPPTTLTSNAIILDGIRDPGNAGTIIRTAVATGYGEIIAIDSVDLYSPKVIRSTMSGIFKVNIRQYKNNEYDKVEKLLKNYTVFSLDMNGENLLSYDNTSENFAVAVGSEAHGISDEMKNISTKILSLPMYGNIESLNASVACGVSMYLLNKNNLYKI